MKTCDNHKFLQKKFVNLVFFSMLVLPCVNIAQDRITLRYHSVQDPAQRLVSRQNFDLALAFAFNSERFDRIWPDYGYNFGDIRGSIGNLCAGGNRNIGIGRSAIARMVQGEFVALPIENNTNPAIVQAFLTEQLPRGQGIMNAGSNDSTNELETITIGDMCRILPENYDELSSAVIVTQHPLPVSERYSYRLLEESILAPESVSE